MANYLSFLGKFWLDSKYKSNNVSQILHSEPKLEENWFLWKFDFIWTHRGNNILIKFAWFYYCSVPKNQSRDWYFLIGIIPIPGLWINRDFASPSKKPQNWFKTSEIIANTILYWIDIILDTPLTFWGAVTPNIRWCAALVHTVRENEIILLTLFFVKIPWNQRFT